MYHFTSKDLRYRYSKTAVPGDNPHITGIPDQSRFSRHEQYEMVTLIQSFYRSNPVRHDAFSAEFGQKIEDLIHRHMPATIQSRQGVFDWISHNFTNYHH